MFRATLLLIPILAGMLVLIAVMFVSLSRQGDERRRMIAEKASAGTLTMYAAYLALCTGLNFYRGGGTGAADATAGSACCTDYARSAVSGEFAIF